MLKDGGHYRFSNQPGLPLPKAAALIRKKIREKKSEIALLEKDLLDVEQAIKGPRPKKKGPKKKSPPTYWSEKA